MDHSMRRRTLSLALAVVACAALCAPVLAVAPREALAAEYHVANYGQLINAISDSNAGDIIYITQDITATNVIRISGNKAVTIMSTGTNASALNRGFSEGAIIEVEPGGVLTLTNITVDGNNISSATAASVVLRGAVTLGDGVTLRNGSAGAVEIYGGGTFTMKEGAAITDNSAGSGGGINIDLGTAIIEGGTISNNTAASGGGIYVGQYNSLKLSGTAAISGNKATNGGGIYVSQDATLELSGSTAISGNKATNGGGVFNVGAFTMTDDTSIFSNTAADFGGGVYNDSVGLFTMNGNATISGNGAKFGGGVCNYGTFTMQGYAAVSGNPAANNGGGVYNHGAFTMEGDAAISGNTSVGNGGGVYNIEIGVFTMTDRASIVGNTSGAPGDGIYMGPGTSFEFSAGTLTDSLFAVQPDDNTFSTKITLSAAPNPFTVAGYEKETSPMAHGDEWPFATASDSTSATAWAGAITGPNGYSFYSVDDAIWVRYLNTPTDRPPADTTPWVNPNTYGPFDAAQFGSLTDGDTAPGDGGAGGGTYVPQTARVVASSLNLRAGGGLSAAILGSLPMNTLVEVLSTTADGWANVRLADGRVGWVSARYLVFIATVEAGGILTTTANLNIRTGPGTGFPVVRVAPRGSSLTATGLSEDGLWVAIDDGGTTRYASAAYLR